MNVTEYFKAIKWNQGSIIDDPSAVKTLLKQSCDSNVVNLQSPDFLLIVTQNCDILHSPEIEPYIDFIPVRYVLKKDGNLHYGKNPRMLQVSIANKTIELNIHDRFRVKKEAFVKVKPKASQIILGKENIKAIIIWISKRLTRAAFPDEFNKRLKNADKQLAVLQKDKIMESVSLIFVNINEEELPPDEKYNAYFKIGVKHGTKYDIRDEIDNKCFKAFDIPGIQAEIDVLDEYDITYKVISTYKRFDWDYRSIIDNPDLAKPILDIDTV